MECKKQMVAVPCLVLHPRIQKGKQIVDHFDKNNVINLYNLQKNVKTANALCFVNTFVIQ